MIYEALLCLLLLQTLSLILNSLSDFFLLLLVELSVLNMCNDFLTEVMRVVEERILTQE